jgi:hypothetical protein
MDTDLRLWLVPSKHRDNATIFLDDNGLARLNWRVSGGVNFDEVISHGDGLDGGDHWRRDVDKVFLLSILSGHSSVKLLFCTSG